MQYALEHRAVSETIKHARRLVELLDERRVALEQVVARRVVVGQQLAKQTILVLQVELCKLAAREQLEPDRDAVLQLERTRTRLNRFGRCLQLRQALNELRSVVTRWCC